MIPGPSTIAEKLAPKRQHLGVKITENPGSAKNPKEDDGDDGAKDGAGDVVSLGEFVMERNLWEWLREYQRSIGGL